jgi:alpha-tubulin suppressor-like RCC1 family protein
VTPSRGVATLFGLLLAGALAGCGGGGGHAVPDGGDALGEGDGAGDGLGDGGASNAIVVDTTSGVMATAKQDGRCDLLEAALAAEIGLSVGDCANPNGVARIVLQPGSIYPLPRALRLSGRTEIGIPDGLSGSAMIEAAPGFVVDPRDASSGCLVSVADGAAQVSLHDVTLGGDPNLTGLTISGACITKGMLNLRRARVTGFRASGVVATCLPAAGCDHESDTEQATTLRVLDSVIDGNRTAGKGGGISSEGSGTTVYVAHSAIVNNASDFDGGGIYLGGGWATDIIEGSTVSGNTTSGSGGGILVRFAEKTNTYTNIIGSTIANNTAASTGGGIEFDPAQLGTQDVSVFSSIVAGNYATSTFEWNINSAWSPTGLFNCVNGSFIYVLPGNPRPTDMGGCKLDVRNPLLGPLMPFGGAGDRPLQPLLTGSLAIDGAVGAGTADEQRDDWIDGLDPTPPPDWTVFDPLVDGDGDGTAARDLGAYERNDRWQTELLAVRAQGPSPHTIVTIPAGYDRGAGTAYAAAGATNELVTYALPIGEAGRYDFTIGVRRDADAGKFQIAVAEDPAGPWTPVGTEQDGYGAASAFATVGPFGSPLFESPGEKLVRFSVTGKNAASAGYRLYLDFIEAKKSTTPCPVAALAAGGNHTCARLGSGGVRCWGGNDSGQLGDGAGVGRASPPAVDVGSGVAAIATGGAHTCALSSDGGVRCWGANGNGQLGDGSTAARATPPADPVLSGVAAIAAGRSHTCALMTTGGVRCWGGNGDGQLGDGSTTDSPRPPTADVLTGAKAVSAGGTHTCALMTSGGVRCWGANGNGQLGDGTTDDRSTPPAADVGGDFAAVSAGDTHTCALTTAGGVRCWGHNADGELGIGRYDVVLSPPTTDVLTGVKQVVASNVFTCALTTSGGVRCWGYNSHGEIGDDTVLAVDRLSPAAVDILGGVTSLAAGAAHVCAVMATGGVRCWGGNDDGQLGDGMVPIIALTPPTMDIPGFTGTCE